MCPCQNSQCFESPSNQRLLAPLCASVRGQTSLGPCTPNICLRAPETVKPLGVTGADHHCPRSLQGTMSRSNDQAYRGSAASGNGHIGVWSFGWHHLQLAEHHQEDLSLEHILDHTSRESWFKMPRAFPKPVSRSPTTKVLCLSGFSKRLVRVFSLKSLKQEGLATPFAEATQFLLQTRVLSPDPLLLQTQSRDPRVLSCSPNGGEGCPW